MDSIFDEDADEVGGEIEAYCPSPRCKADTTHTIISMYEDEVRRVQCVVCGDVHAYRKPRGDSAEVGDAAPEPTTRVKRSVKPGWEDAMARASDADLANCRPYSIRDTYEEGDIVSHPVFDIGIVTELLPDNKVEITFKEPPPRILVHNRGDLAPRMPGISETPPPREQKKKKRTKKKEEPVHVERRSAKDMADALDLARQAAQAKMDGGVPPKPLTATQKAAAAKIAAKPAGPVVAVKAGGGAKGAPERPGAKAAAAKAAAAPAKAAASAKAGAAKPAKAEPAKAAKGAAKADRPAAKAAGGKKAVPAKKAPAKAGAAKKPVAKAAGAAAKKPAPAKKPAAKAAAKKPAPAKKPAAKAAAKKPAKKKK